MTLDKLAEMVARGFSHMEDKMDKMVTKDDFDGFKNETAENFKKVRRDILAQGDRFVTKQAFDTHVTRFNALEAKVKSKLR